MILLTLFALISSAFGLIAYDCGSPNMNITTMSLRSIGECKIPTNEPVVESKYVQLLQLNEFSNVHVIQCKVEIDRTIYYCGMHSHVSIVANGRMDYVMEVGSDICTRMHLTRSFAFGTRDLVTGLRANDTVTKSVTIAGKISNNGKCNGISYADPYGSWDDVVVQGVVRVTLRDYYAVTRPDADKIMLRSGTQCTLSDGKCIDFEGGYTFWAPVPNDHCKFNSYDVLYEGKANKIYDNTTDKITVVYAVTTDDVTFALARKGQQSICNYEISRTEHPKLFILETKEGESFTKRKSTATSNLDIFTYVNSKFVYLEKHIRTQMKNMYTDVIRQQCQIEKQMMENALTLAKITPEDFSHYVMKSPGYMAVVAGEVVHIVKCVPVTVKRRETKECYQQLPVLRGNKTYFMAPRTNILMKTGTEIDCNPYVPTMYQLDGTWYKISPSAASTIPPKELEPATRNTWTYSNPESLATSGIYSTEELNKLRDHIMFPVERPAVLNTIARGMTGQSAERQGVSFVNLLDEATLEEIASTTWNRLWGWFTGFGTISAGMLGVFVTIRLIKFVIDTALHGYALQRTYGWSIHLIGAVWDSVTNVLLHLDKTRNKKQKRNVAINTDSIEPTAPESNSVYPEMSNESTFERQPPPLPSMPPAIRETEQQRQQRQNLYPQIKDLSLNELRARLDP